ncbi:MAG: hypothetical protein M0038_16075 [Pseudomonadota bacterium]|nr:hypothetical protein [Pseudomonadota bacterium]
MLGEQVAKPFYGQRGHVVGERVVLAYRRHLPLQRFDVAALLRHELDEHLVVGGERQFCGARLLLLQQADLLGDGGRRIGGGIESLGRRQQFA